MYIYTYIYFVCGLHKNSPLGLKTTDGLFFWITALDNKRF